MCLNVQLYFLFITESVILFICSFIHLKTYVLKESLDSLTTKRSQGAQTPPGSTRQGRSIAGFAPIGGIQPGWLLPLLPNEALFSCEANSKIHPSSKLFLINLV